MKKITTLLIVLLSIALTAQEYIPNLPHPRWEQTEHSYKLTNKKAVGWGLLFTAGVLEGARSATLYDRSVWEKKWDVNPDNSFWGSNSHDQDNLWSSHMGAFDYQHISRDVAVLATIGGTFLITKEGLKLDQPAWHTAADLLGCIISVSVGYKVGYYYATH